MDKKETPILFFRPENKEHQELKTLCVKSDPSTICICTDEYDTTGLILFSGGYEWNSIPAIHRQIKIAEKLKLVI